MAGADPGFDGTVFGTVPLQLQSVKDIDVKATCPNQKNICNNMGCVTAGTFTPGVERYEFKGYATIGPTSGIPAACCNIRFSFSVCCRTAQLNTGAAGEGMYNETVMNRCYALTTMNSSPVFKNDPKITINGSEHFVGNWGAVDADHDSLSYSFAPALKSRGVSVSYNAPFAYDRPLPWTGAANGLYPMGISCDPLNGDIMFTPPNSGTTFTGILCVAVKEWKKINGVQTLIGTTTRDILVSIIYASPNNAPRFITNPPDESGNINVPGTAWATCEGEPFCFTVTAKDTDFNPSGVRSDTTYLNWDGAIASLGATFVPDYDITKRQKPDSLGGGPREDRYKFCWTPPIGAGSATPYYFTVSAADNRCPTPGELTRAFSILVMAKPSAQIVKGTGNCNQVLLSYSNTTPDIVITTAAWRIANVANDSAFVNGYTIYPASTTPTPFPIKTAGRYYIQLILTGKGPIGQAGCSKTINDYIDAPGVLLRDSIQKTDLTCALIPSGKLIVKGYNGTAPYQYKLNNQAYSFTDTFTNLVAGTYVVKIKDVNNCEIIDSTVIKQPEQLINVVQPVSPVCHDGSNGSITVHASGGTPPFTYNINQQIAQSDSVFTNLSSGKYTVTIKDVSGCTKQESAELTNPAALQAQYTAVKASCFNGGNGKIIVAPKTGKTPFIYQINQQISQSDSVFVNLTAGKYRILFSDSNACTQADSVELANPLALSAQYHITPVSCFNGTNGKILVTTQNGKAPFTYRINQEPVQASAVFENLQAGKYLVSFKDSDLCERSDSVTVTQPTVLSYVKNKTDITCNNLNNGALSIIPGGGTAPYQLLFDSVVYPLPYTLYTIRPGIYPYYIIDNKNCTVELIDTFLNPPLIIAGTISGDSSVTLSSVHSYTIPFQQGLSYLWAVTGGGTILSSSQNPPSVTIQWDSAGTGIVSVIVSSSNTCDDDAELFVTVGSVGLNKLTKQSGIEIYPNPAKTVLNISLQQVPKNNTVQLYDIHGRLLIQQELKPQQQLNIETLSPGMYLLKIGSWTGHVVKE